MNFFWVGHFEFFFSKKKKFFASFPWKLAQIYMVEWMGRWVLMFSLVSRKFLAMRNIALYSVCIMWGRLGTLAAPLALLRAEIVHLQGGTGSLRQAWLATDFKSVD